MKKFLTRARNRQLEIGEAKYNALMRSVGVEQHDQPPSGFRGSMVSFWIVGFALAILFQFYSGPQL